MGLCLAYQLTDRGGRLVPVVQQKSGSDSESLPRIRLPSEKRPFSILLPPTFHYGSFFLHLLDYRATCNTKDQVHPR
jgi:hypothetical protein